MRNSGTSVIHNRLDGVDRNTVQLYQDKPFINCTYTEHTLYSTTDCLESYNNWARKMKLILQRNHQFRQARYEIYRRRLKIPFSLVDTGESFRRGASAIPHGTSSGNEKSFCMRIKIHQTFRNICCTVFSS